MIEDLRKNIDAEIGMLREISKFINIVNGLNEEEKRIVYGSVNSLKESMKIINNSIAEIIQEISPAKNLPGHARKTNLERINFTKSSGNLNVILNRNDKEKLIKELSLNEKLIKKLKTKKVEQIEEEKEYSSPRGYLRLSNKLFFNLSRNYTKKGYFKSLALEIRKANFNVLTETYLAALFFSVFLIFICVIFLTVFLTIFNITSSSPFITAYSGNYFQRLIKFIWMPFILPLIGFIAGYLYPSTEKDSISKKIEREIPFATIHMSAISGSGISPIEIFRIIGTSKDYPYLGREIKKILNQINLYGYDMVTALGNISRSTPSTKLSELLSGLTTTLNSGGSLKTFFEKRAESLLMDYKMEREKYTKTAETFMDVYITVVVAAPMILMLLLIIISMTGFQANMGPQQMTFILISIIAFINIVFLGILQAKQPGY